MRREKKTVAITAYDMKVDGKRPRGRPKTRWFDVIRKDMKNLDISEVDALDRAKWRLKTRFADPAAARD